MKLIIFIDRKRDQIQLKSIQFFFSSGEEVLNSLILDIIWFPSTFCSYKS